MQNKQNDPLGYYEVLKSSIYSSDEEIKKNYREEAKIWHPDSNSSEEALEIFQKISVAYDVLKDKEKRITYDLLSQIYTRRNFPEMFSLKIYKNQNDGFDMGLRSLSQTQVVSKLYKCEIVNLDEVCNYQEAKKIVFKTSLWNWILGWWSLQGLVKNLGVIFKNIVNINKNDKGNLRILLHNALAYNQEGRKSEAHFYAKEALSYADDFQKKLILSFLEDISEERRYTVPKWNYEYLKAIQLIVPVIFLALISFFLIKNGYIFESKKKENDNKINYYQEVNHMGGNRGFDDVVVSQIFDIPVDIENDKMLYHINKEVKALHGPSKNFDVLRKVDAKTTVRLTGYSPDGVWYRIMFDDGLMGFIPTEFASRGIGKSIPRGSKISYPRDD